MLKKLMQAHPGLTLGVAESLTGGHLQARVAAESGASAYFMGGVTAYTIARKVDLLGVNRAKAKACNGVSGEVARQMARGACKLMKCNLGVSTTGYAEPDLLNGVPAPKAHWAVCHIRKDGKIVLVDGYGEFPGMSRAKAQRSAARGAVATLAAYLASLP